MIMYYEPLKRNEYNFNLEGMKVGDSFFGCLSCNFQLDKSIKAAKSQCPICLGSLKIYTVQQEDLK